MRHIVIFLLLCMFAAAVSAQTLTGRVKGKDGVTLEGASVVVKSENNKIVTYSITDNKGAFVLNMQNVTDGCTMTVSYIGYEKKAFAAGKLRNGMTVVLDEGGFQIKEVKVKTQRIRGRGDTLTYSVAGFKQAQDRSIADVIAKMPGLEVKSDGKIEYQGKAINKFYIEGLDLMGSQYGVANKNLQAGKVKSVQVIENHQAVKSLRGVSFSDQAALNLVLQDDAKAVWSGTADIGAGYGDEMLYDSRLMGMCFKKNFQTLMMYKNNNTGRNIGNEVLNLTVMDYRRNSVETGILSMAGIGAPQISEERCTFNQSHLAAGNWLWKTGKDSELRLQGSGLIDKTSMNRYSSVTYLTLDGLPMVTEDQSVDNTRSEWKAEANYQYNGDRTYIKNNITGYIDFNGSTGMMLCDGSRTDICVKPHKRSLTEDFRLSHTCGNGNVYDISSYISYNFLPGQLLTVNGMTECLNLCFLTVQNAMTYKLKLGRHYFNNTVGADYDWQDIAVSMDGSGNRSGAYRLWQGYWLMSTDFVWGSHSVNASAKLSCAHQSYKASESSHLWADPSLSWNWKVSVSSDLSANLSYRHSPLTGKAIYDTPIFTGYRTQKTNRGETGVQNIINASAAYKYSDPIKGIFFNIRPMFMRASGNILYENSLNGSIYTITATDRDYATVTAGLSSRVSKAFGWAKLYLGIVAAHNITDYSMLIAGNVNDARMHGTQITLDYSLRPVRWVSVEGKSGMHISRQQNLTLSELSAGTTTAWQHSMGMYFFPASKWTVSLSNDLFHSSEPGFKTNYFCDLSVSYRAERWELALYANNVLGTSAFEQRTLGNTVETYSLTRLRPREFLAKWSIDL